MAKEIIYYHRAYRKITGSGRRFLIELFCLGAILLLLFLFVYPEITKVMSLFAHYILSSYFIPDTVQVFDQSFLLAKIYFVSIPGKYPSTTVSIVNLLLSLSLIILLPQAKRNKNIAIFFTFMAIINLASAIFFTISPSEFPYTVTQFSELYVKTQISMWFFLLFILGMAILLLPSSVFPKLVLILLTLLYSIIFGSLRYILFLFVVTKFSIIYMPLLFFSFGPLIDFVYIVGIYSYYNSRLARNLQGNRMVWKWLF